MTAQQKKIVIQLLGQAGYVEEKGWWVNHKAKTMLTKVDLFGDEDNDKIVQSNNWGGFIEQLMAANPYHVAYERGKPPKEMPYNVWNECVDKAAQILGGKGEEGEWMPIETAPKDGTEIQVNYGTPEKPEDVCEAFWSQRPVCMLGNRNGGFPPGWATTGNKTDKNLPLDPPKYWRPL